MKYSQIIRYKFPHPRGGGYSAGGVHTHDDGRVTLSHGMLTRTNVHLGASHSRVPVELQITFDSEDNALRAVRNWAEFLGYELKPKKVTRNRVKHRQFPKGVGVAPNSERGDADHG